MILGIIEQFRTISHFIHYYNFTLSTFFLELFFELVKKQFTRL